ncbi:MAG: universal stress protein [Candidatus Sulfotelmatobacter sp.]|jgi:nucleotide-binding universal stress UspA family protein
MPTVPQVTRLSLKNILFPTDFSPASRAALPFAVALARIYGSTLVVAHAIPPEPHLQVVLDRLPSQDDRVRQDARHKLHEFTHGRSLGNTPVKVLLDQGDLQDVIPAIIRERDIDLVVLGTHGRRGLSKLMLGSDAEKIYRSASCPVLTIGPHVHETADWKLRRILCPVDVAEDPEVVLHYALSLAEENQAELVVLQAIPLVPWQHRAAVEERSRRALESLMPAQAQDWCTPEYVIRWEHPVEAILQTSQERDSDLIVMSVHKARASGLAAHLPWPVASEVVSRATCPVLTIRV